MYCKKCGAEIADDSEYCNKCGAQQNEKPVPAPAKPAAEAPGSTLILVLGILSVALNVVFSASIGGIVCGILCRIRVREYIEAGYALTAKVKTGKTLGQVGLIVSIVSTALTVLIVTFYLLFYFGIIALVFGILSNVPDAAQYMH